MGRKMKKSNTLVFGSIIVIIVIFIGIMFVKSDSNIETSKVIGIGSFSQAIDYSPLYVAKHFNWFETAVQDIGDYEIIYSELGGFDEINTLLVQNKLHILFSAEAPVIKLVADGNKLRIAGLSCTLQQDILVTNKSKIDSIEGLKGKQVAVAEGTSSHYGLLNILEEKGLTAENITLRPGFPGEIKPLFEAGEIDAWAVWPPFVEQQIIKGNGKSLVGGNAKIQSVYSLSNSTIENKQLSKTLIGVVERAKDWMKNNPEESMVIIAQYLGMELDVVRLAWPKHNWGANIDETVLLDIREKSFFLKRVGVIRESQEVPKISNLVMTIN
jgi:sulfonate transport system substrate-binding protein